MIRLISAIYEKYTDIYYPHKLHIPIESLAKVSYCITMENYIPITTETTAYDTVSLYLVVPVGMEDLAKHELYEKLDLYFPDAIIPEVVMGTGGIEINWELFKGLLLNSILKIPTRILLRLDQFKCRDFPKLFKKIQTLSWNKFITSEQLSFKITSQNSRLFHTKRVEKSIKDGLKQYFKGNPPKKKFLEMEALNQEVFVRIDNDICTISINTSGAPLYKRGLKTYTSEAPIRENLAASLLYNLYRLSPADKIEMIDPMCGSGTFLFEASTFYSPNFHRGYAFQSWPLLHPLAPLHEIIHEQFTPHLYQKVTGYDIDSQTVQVAKMNLKNHKIPDATIFQRDLLSDSDLQGHGKNIIILNPPYGVRIPTFEHIENFYHHIFEKLETDFSPELFGIIIPCGFSYRKILISGYKLVEKRQFSNGGLKVQFHIFKKIIQP